MGDLRAEFHVKRRGLCTPNRNYILCVNYVDAREVRRSWNLGGSVSGGNAARAVEVRYGDSGCCSTRDEVARKHVRIAGMLTLEWWVW
jgi:hypothetical protein